VGWAFWRPVRWRSVGVRPARWLPVALAASLILTVVVIHEHRKREQGLQARQQLIEALRVTGEKLDLAYRAVNAS
jgi:sensor domain CHASE-containing protein